MKYSYIQMTDEGKRELLRDLSYQLTNKKIAELIDQYADGVKVDANGDPFIKIDAQDVEDCAVPVYTHWLDIDHVEIVTANEEDYE